MVIGIEVKLSDWTRALRQAILNRYAVDVSMIAMPAERLTARVLDAATQHGIGVIAIQSTGWRIILPGSLNSPDGTLRDRIQTQLKPIRGRRCSALPDEEIGWSR